MTDERGSIWHRLYAGETSFDFVGRRNRWFAISGLVIVVGLAALGIRGLNFGIDFKGGSVWEVPAKTACAGALIDQLTPVGS